MRNHALFDLMYLCSTAYPTPTQEQAVARVITRLTDWTELVRAFESNGIAPLGALHLAHRDEVPLEIRRQLQALAMRHRLASRARRSCVKAALASLKARGIDNLLLKGAAVAELAYPEPSLRAMRDVDLLVRDGEIDSTIRALNDAGFGGLTWARFNRHEVVSLSRTEGGFTITIDVHRRLGLLSLPSYAPLERQTLDALLPDAITLTIDGMTARTPSLEDLLRGVYRHGFCLQLDEDRLRAVSVADCACLLSRYGETLRWEWLEEIDAQVVESIGRLEHLTPLPPAVLERIGYTPRRRPWAVGESFWGWPTVRKARKNRWWLWLIATLLPSEWWLLVRHGGGYGPDALLRAWLSHLGELGLLATRQMKNLPRRER